MAFSRTAHCRFSRWWAISVLVAIVRSVRFTVPPSVMGSSRTGGSCVTARNRGLGDRLFVSHVATSVATFGAYPTHQIDATMASLALLVVRPPIWSLVASALLHLQVARRWKPALRRGIANPRRCESTCKRTWGDMARRERH